MPESKLKKIRELIERDLFKKRGISENPPKWLSDSDKEHWDKDDRSPWAKLKERSDERRHAQIRNLTLAIFFIGIGTLLTEPREARMFVPWVFCKATALTLDDKCKYPFIHPPIKTENEKRKEAYQSGLQDGMRQSKHSSRFTRITVVSPRSRPRQETSAAAARPSCSDGWRLASSRRTCRGPMNPSSPRALWHR